MLEVWLLACMLLVFLSLWSTPLFSGKLSQLEVWLLSCMLLVFLSLVEFAIILR